MCLGVVSQGCGGFSGEAGAGHTQFQLIPAGSAMTLGQGTATPVSDASGTSGKVCLRKGEML